MNYWLVKTEPDTYSWEDLEKQANAMWDGVRNYQARNNLRQMLLGDKVLVYYSGKAPAIIGLAQVVKEYYSDPTAKEGDWSVVDLRAIRKFSRNISLSEIKQIKDLQEMTLLKNTRLSVQPVRENEFSVILSLSEYNIETQQKKNKVKKE